MSHLATIQDNKEYSKMYETFRQQLIGVAKKYVAEDIAEDLVQDLYETLWVKQKWKGIDPPVLPYLIKSIKNNCLQFLDLLSQKNTCSANDKEDYRATDDKNPEEQLIQKEQERIIAKAVENLSEKQKEVIKLWMQHFSDKEIAEKLKISETSVRTHWNRGMKILKTTMPKF